MEARVNVTAERELDQPLAARIADVQLAAFPKTTEFAYQRWWHTPPAPDDLWFTLSRSGQVIGSVVVIHRTILAGPSRLTVAGIGNVCSHPDHRGEGAARQCMRKVQEYIAGHRTLAAGLLFCGVSVRGFYARLGWQEIANPLRHVQPDGQPVWTDCRQRGGMAYPGRVALADWPTGLVDLQGPDW